MRGERQASADAVVVSLAYKPSLSESGSPVVFRAGAGGLMAGILTGYQLSTNTGYVDLLSDSDVQSFLQRFAPRAGAAATCGLDVDLGMQRWPPHERSWFWNAARPLKFIPLGIEDKRVSYRPRWVRHPLLDSVPGLEDWVRAAGGADFAVPAFRPFVGPGDGDELVYRDPQGGKIAGARGECYMPPELLKLAAAEYLSAFPGEMERVRPLSFDQAVFGDPSQGIGALDLGKSAGDWGGLKADYVDEVSRTLKPRLLEACIEIERTFREGGFRPHKLTSQLKDELRSWDKCLRGATRHISPTSFPFMVVQRRWLAPLAAAILKLGVETSTMAIGVNAADPRQWREVYRAASSKSPDGYLSDADFGDYDINTQVDAAWEESDIMADVAARCGWSESEQTMAFASAWFAFFADAVLDGVRLLLLQGRWSGVWGTDVMNSIQAFLKLCCAWYIVSAQRGLPFVPFRQAISMVSTGDDHILGAAVSVREWFHSASIAAALAPYGDRYTNADKTVATAGSFKPPAKASFLQRSFVDGGDGLLRAPLLKGRIARPLWLIRPSKSVSLAAQAEATILNAQYELFLHGRRALTEFQVLFTEPVPMPDGSTFRVRLVDYDEVYGRFKDGRLRTWDAGGQAFGSLDAADDARQAMAVTSGQEESTFVLGNSVAPMEHTDVSESVRESSVAVAAVAPAVPRGMTPFGDFRDLLGRVVDVGTFTVASTTTQTTAPAASYYVLPAWLGVAQIQRKVANFQYARGLRFGVHFYFASTPQHRGAAVFSVLPGSCGLRTSMTVQQAVQLRGIVRTLSGPFTVELGAGLVSAAGSVVDLIANTSSYGYLAGPVMQFHVLSPLSHCSLATAPPVQLVMRVCLMEGEFFSPSDYSTFAVTSAREESRGVFSRLAYNASAVLAHLGKYPPFAQWALPASIAVGAVGRVAHLLGFSRPTRREPPMLMAMAPNSDLASRGTADAAYPLGVDVASETAPHPGAGGWEPVDMMALENLQSIWGLCGGSSVATEFSTSYTVGEIIMAIPVCPILNDGGIDGSAPQVWHPCALIGSSYAQWRGRARYKVIAFPGSLDAGRLRIVYVPATGVTTSALPPLMRYSKLLDVQSGGEMEFVVDWHQVFTFLPLPQQPSNIPSTQYLTASTSSAFCNGVVYLVVDSPLVSNQATTAIGISVFVQWEDLDFARPSTWLLSDMYATSGPDVPAIGDPRDRAYAAADGAKHLRALLTQFRPEAGFVLEKTLANTTHGTIGWSLPRYKSPFATLVTNQNWVMYDTWGLACNAFMGVRGGSVRRAYLVPGTTAGETFQLVGFHTGYAGCVSASGSPAQSTGGTGEDGTLVSPAALVWSAQSNWGTGGLAPYVPGVLQLCTTELPWRNTVMWLPTANAPTYASSGVGDETMVFIGAYTGAGTSANALSNTLELWWRAADDIVLGGFMGMPQMITQSLPSHP
jgi:hypothetical protein